MKYRRVREVWRLARERDYRRGAKVDLERLVSSEGQKEEARRRQLRTQKN